MSIYLRKFLSQSFRHEGTQPSACLVIRVNMKRFMQGKCDGNTTIPASMANTPNPPGDVPAGTCVLGAEEGLLRLPSSNHFFYMNSIHLHAIPVPPGTTYIDDQTGAENPTTGPNTKYAANAACPVLQHPFCNSCSSVGVPSLQ